VQTLDVRPGDMLKAGAPVATLLLQEEPWIVVYVPESRLASVALGQAASVRPDGYAEVTGKVTWISRRAEYTPRNVQTRGDRVTQVFAVKVVLQGDTGALKDGMWADVRFQ
jgi:HlyD family secretion protein